MQISTETTVKQAMLNARIMVSRLNEFITATEQLFAKPTNGSTNSKPVRKVSKPNKSGYWISPVAAVLNGVAPMRPGQIAKQVGLNPHLLGVLLAGHTRKPDSPFMRTGRGLYTLRGNGAA